MKKEKSDMGQHPASLISRMNSKINHYISQFEGYTGIASHVLPTILNLVLWLKFPRSWQIRCEQRAKQLLFYSTRIPKLLWLSGNWFVPNFHQQFWHFHRVPYISCGKTKPISSCLKGSSYTLCGYVQNSLVNYRVRYEHQDRVLENDLLLYLGYLTIWDFFHSERHFSLIIYSKDGMHYRKSFHWDQFEKKEVVFKLLVQAS